MSETPDLGKLPEDADGNGLTEHASIRWLLWLSDAVTEFCNGVIAGAPMGAVVGGANAASTDTMNTHALTFSAFLGFMTAAIGNGLKHLIVWHHEHPMPNPFRP